jgi:hypothetical protein
MSQLAAVTPVGLNLITVLLRYQTGRRNNALCSVFNEMIMQPETKITGFIYGVYLVPFVKVSLQTGVLTYNIVTCHHL